MNLSKRIIAAALSVCMCLAGASCAGSSKDYFYKNKTEEYIYRYGDYTVDKNFYTYWLARYKAVLMYSYSDIEDTDEYWNKDYGNGSADVVLTAYADETVKNYLTSLYLFSKYGLSMSEDKVDSVDSQLSEILLDGFEGNVAKLNEQAYEFGINYNMLRQIYIAEAKTEIVYNYMTGALLSEKLNDELRDSYLYDNYARTTHIFISTENSYNIDEDGNIIYDSDGKYTAELTEEQKKEKQELIDKIDDAAPNSENFSEFQKQYNEDPAVDKYENGYFVSTQTDYDTRYITAALSMETGEVKKVQTDDGVFYILKKPMIAKAYSDSKNKDFFPDYDKTVLDHLYWEEMENYYKEIIVNEELKKGISIKTVRPCFYF